MTAEDELILAERAKYERMWQHDDYRTFSPGLHALEHLDLVGCFRKLGVRSILDAGCGSGKFMRRILEKHAGEFAIRGFDIAANCLDPWFTAREAELLTTGCLWDPAGLPRPNDAVVCTDVLEHIPTDKVPAVLANLRAAATKAVFLGIALFPDGFGPKVLGRPLHLTVQTTDWWRAQTADAGLAPISGVVQKHQSGQPMWFFLLARPVPPTTA
ncbi:MAG TPA: class I SAM-dependent methyltransferase [Opitutaceae bacterium]|nr:class I SAM-dependent methyltransferase [Opitutaceae bacterium]